MALPREVSVDLYALFGRQENAADLCPELSPQTLTHAGGIDLESLEGAAVTMSAEIALAETNLVRFLNTAWLEASRSRCHNQGHPTVSPTTWKFSSSPWSQPRRPSQSGPSVKLAPTRPAGTDPAGGKRRSKPI